jgi:N-acetyl sugar amidotransferase
MEICKNCVLDSTVPNFFLDNQGFCNFCFDWKNKKNKFINKSDLDIDKEITKIINNIKSYSKKNNSAYDCILGLSGGTDSSYVAYHLWKMGLKTLIIHLDNNWNTSVSNSNINKILEVTKFDYKTLILDWEEFKDLQLSFLKAGVPDIELVTDHAIFSYVQNFALRNRIKFIFSGVNFATEHSVVPEWGWRKDDFNHIKKIHNNYGKIKLTNYPKNYILKRFFFEKIIKKIEIVYFLNVINYNSTQAKEILKKEFNWIAYANKHEESFFTKFFQNYILPVKFKIDKRKIHYSCLIRNNELERKKALEMLQVPSYNYDQFDNEKKFFLKKLCLTEKEFSEIMKENPKKHSDFSWDWTNNKLIKLLKGKFI